MGRNMEEWKREKREKRDEERKQETGKVRQPPRGQLPKVVVPASFESKGRSEDKTRAFERNDEAGTRETSG